jgi:aryl-alcohol dehydrogenase-like predicted oxidoreductase
MFFLGDRVPVMIDDAMHQQDPPFVLVHHFYELADTFEGRTAPAKKCANTETGFLPADPKARPVTLHKLLPLPPAWWSFFLTHDRTPTKTYQWITKITWKWRTKEKKWAADYTKQWLRAACTESSDSATDSSVAIAVHHSPPRDTLLVQWASRSLHHYLPRPKPTPVGSTNTQPPMETPTPPSAVNQLMAAMTQMMAFAQEVIKNSTEWTDRE